MKLQIRYLLAASRKQACDLCSFLQLLLIVGGKPSTNHAQKANIFFVSERGSMTWMRSLVNVANANHKQKQANKCSLLMQHS